MDLICWYFDRYWQAVIRCLGVTLLALAGSLPGANAAEIPRPDPDAPAKDYVLWYRNYDSPPVIALIRLALDETPEYGPYTISRSVVMGQGRAVRELSESHKNFVTIANVATSLERERELMAIPIPIDGGLLGLRVCVIKKTNQAKFRNIQSLDDLTQRGIRIGQGRHWPDTPILRANGVEVITNTRFETLFRMLESERFDCFARGVNEVLFDLDKIRDSNLMIEPDLLIAYPMPSYFFVAPDDQETAMRIQLGMERAIRDGRFAKYLKRFYLAAVNSLDLEQRTVLVLNNPLLSDDSRAIGRKALSTLKQRINGTR